MAVHMFSMPNSSVPRPMTGMDTAPHSIMSAAMMAKNTMSLTVNF